MLTAANEEFNTAPGGIIGSELISSKYWFLHIILYQLLINHTLHFVNMFF